MFGLGKKTVRNTAISKFAFEVLPDPVAPSVATADILWKQNQIRILWTTLIVGTLASLFFGFSVEASAVTEPYVADGGVFGCPVPFLDTEAKGS